MYVGRAEGVILLTAFIRPYGVAGSELFTLSWYCKSLAGNPGERR